MLRIAIWSAFRDALASLKGQSRINPPDELILTKDPVLGAHLCLFAPAHLGSRLPRSLSAVLVTLAGLHKIGPVLLDAIGFALPSISDLDNQNPVLSDVRKYTESSSEEYPLMKALRAHVVWGVKEKFVDVWQYKWDGPIEYVDDRGHVAVCKPDLEYLRPLEFVAHE